MTVVKYYLFLFNTCSVFLNLVFYGKQIVPKAKNKVIEDKCYKKKLVFSNYYPILCKNTLIINSYCKNNMFYWNFQHHFLSISCRFGSEFAYFVRIFTSTFYLLRYKWEKSIWFVKAFDFRFLMELVILGCPEHTIWLRLGNVDLSVWMCVSDIKFVDALTKELMHGIS